MLIVGADECIPLENPRRFGLPHPSSVARHGHSRNPDSSINPGFFASPAKIVGLIAPCRAEHVQHLERKRRMAVPREPQEGGLSQNPTLALHPT
jgi:hypothetical protein